MAFRKSNKVKTVVAIRRAKQKVRSGEFIPAVHRDDRGHHVAHVHKYGANGQPARPVAKIVVDPQGRRVQRRDH